MKKNILILLIFFSTMAIRSQEIGTFSGELSGNLMEAKTNLALPYASVVLKDSIGNIVEGVITDEEGIFHIANIVQGSFMLEIQYNGFQTYATNVQIESENQTVELGTIQLTEDATQLNEVVVTGETSPISLRLDKKVFNVGKDILAQSGSVTDVLSNVPSVAVSPSGAVSLRGNSNVTILINGRRSGLTSNQALEQIPSDNVERVEVISNPSARYAASGSAGIINIILKKNRNKGFNGQVRLVTGIPTDLRIIGSLNYKTEKLNLFSNFGIRYTDYVGLYTTNQETTNNGSLNRLQQQQDEDRHDDGQFFYFGSDFFINDYNTITAAFLRNETKDSDKTDLNYNYSSLGTRDSTLFTYGTSKEKRSYNQLEMNYTKTFEKEDKKFTVDLQYDFWDSTKDFNIETSQTFPTVQDISDLRTTSDQKNNDFALQSDFVTPLTEESKLEMGVKFEKRLVKNGFLAEDLSGRDFQSIDGFNNELDYDEQIFGAYSQYGNKIKKFSYLLGLRFENTYVKIKDAIGSFNQTNSYSRLFPTLNLGYDISEMTKIQGSYSKRINRPSLWQLNPFPKLSDFNLRFSGNPNLQPSFSDAIELALLIRAKDFTLNPSIYYSRTNNNIEYYTIKSAEGFFLTSMTNIDSEKRFGIEVSLSYNPKKWLGINGEVNAYNFEKRGQIAAINLNTSNITWRSSWALNIKPKKGLNIQSRFNYRGPFSNAQTKTKSVSSLNIGVSQRIFKDKGSLILNVRNVFNSNKFKEETLGEDFVIDVLSNYNAARWTLSFVYKFNKKTGEKNREAKRSNRN